MLPSIIIFIIIIARKASFSFWKVFFSANYFSLTISAHEPKVGAHCVHWTSVFDMSIWCKSARQWRTRLINTCVPGCHKGHQKQQKHGHWQTHTHFRLPAKWKSGKHEPGHGETVHQRRVCSAVCEWRQCITSGQATSITVLLSYYSRAYNTFRPVCVGYASTRKLSS